MITKHLAISGRVQGVGYRYAFRREANKQGAAGWVRNRRDGGVEAVIQGTPDAVEALIAWSRRGPPGAGVTEVLAGPVPAEFDRAYEQFEVWPTV